MGCRVHIIVSILSMKYVPGLKTAKNSGSKFLLHADPYTYVISKMKTAAVEKLNSCYN